MAAFSDLLVLPYLNTEYWILPYLNNTKIFILKTEILLLQVFHAEKRAQTVENRNKTKQQTQKSPLTSSVGGEASWVKQAGVLVERQGRVLTLMHWRKPGFGAVTSRQGCDGAKSWGNTRYFLPWWLPTCWEVQSHRIGKMFPQSWKNGQFWWKLGSRFGTC